VNAENPPLTDQSEGADPEPEELTRTELEREQGEPLPDREGTMNALSDQATVERDPDAIDETTTKGGLDV
jgi:hypothetical protein